jgi:hypothetical protein
MEKITYKLLENKIPLDTIEYLQQYTLKVKQKILEVLGNAKENGSGVYWRGCDMASSLPIASDEENERLYNVYTSEFMFNIISDYIPTPYLFNDQIVVKEPNENFEFGEHFDNQFGPSPEDKELLTINCMLVLDDFTDENGRIEVFDKEWITLYPKKGDILLIEGFTPHRSLKNNSESARRAYLCVYSNKPIGQNFQKGYYYQPFKVQ